MAVAENWCRYEGVLRATLLAKVMVGLRDADTFRTKSTESQETILRTNPP
jgi:hypothetical protein